MLCGVALGDRGWVGMALGEEESGRGRGRVQGKGREERDWMEG